MSNVNPHNGFFLEPNFTCEQVHNISHMNEKRIFLQFSFESNVIRVKKNVCRALTGGGGE